MKHLGDITKIDGARVPAVDIITGGSPCQDLSVAGKRAGLAGERSGLFMEQIRIIKEMQDEDRHRRTADDFRHLRPRFMVWENVPGAFSSNKGEDFRAVLEETAKIAEPGVVIPRPPDGKWSHAGCIMADGWSIAWRLHDAQYWGLLQRRKRIALVADFRGGCAPEILFECEGVSGDTPEGEEQGKGAPGGIEDSAGKPGQIYDVRISSDGTSNWRAHAYETDRARALDTGGANPDSNHGGVCIIEELKDIVYCLQGNCIDRSDTAGCNGRGWRENQSYTLNTIDRPAIFDARGNGTGQLAPTITGDHQNRITDYTAICVENGQLNQSPGRMAGALNCMHDQQIVCLVNDITIKTDENETAFSIRSRDFKDPQSVAIGLDRAAYNQGRNAKYDFSVETEKIGAQTAKGPGAVCAGADMPIVRRLTPLECERLQGFPDGWTDIGDWVDSKGKKRKGDSDAPRYKALGNSIALPFWEWMAQRMLKALGKENPTMASLFDGIGGFPLVFSRHGCIPVWASEIEEFPIAVTKKHFPE